MADYNIPLSDRLAPAATIDPQTQTAGALNSDAVDMQDGHRALFILMLGAITATGTMDMKLQGSADGSTGWGDITGKAITQLTDADGDKQVMIEITDEELVAANAAYRYVRAVVTNATADALMSLIALLADLRYGPASDHSLASVDETVA
jgi:hypothetical protein